MNKVFNKIIDEKLLEMLDEDGTTIYRIYDEGIKLSDIIYNPKDSYDEIDKKLIETLETNNIDLNKPVIAHLAATHIFGDYGTYIVNKDYYLYIGYYSAGDNIAGFSVYKWKDGETKFFDIDNDMEYMPMNKIIMVERDN